MLEKAIEKSEAWIARWSDLVFHPRESGRAAGIRPVEFLVGNVLLSYVACLAHALSSSVHTIGLLFKTTYASVVLILLRYYRLHSPYMLY